LNELLYVKHKSKMLMKLTAGSHKSTNSSRK
jgi:hypothetical protein